MSSSFSDCPKAYREKTTKSNSATSAVNLVFPERKWRKNNTGSQEIARKIYDFQISADSTHFIENPQIFDESFRHPFVINRGVRGYCRRLPYRSL